MQRGCWHRTKVGHEVADAGVRAMVDMVHEMSRR